MPGGGGPYIISVTFLVCLTKLHVGLCNTLPPPPPAICQNTSYCNGGTCYGSTSNLSAAMCVCPANRYGPQCQYTGSSDPCVSNNYCNGHGVCSYGMNHNDNDNVISVCNCSHEYASGSSSCSFPTINYCFRQPCSNGGICDMDASVKARTAVCLCPASKCS